MENMLGSGFFIIDASPRTHSMSRRSRLVSHTAFPSFSKPACRSYLGPIFHRSVCRSPGQLHSVAHRSRCVWRTNCAHDASIVGSGYASASRLPSIACGNRADSLIRSVAGCTVLLC